MLGQVADTLTDPGRSGTMVAWRLHGFGVLLDTDPSVFSREAEKLDLDEITQVAVDTLRALATRPTLGHEIEKAIREGTNLLGSTRIRDSLTTSGLEAEWQDASRDLLGRVFRETVDTPEFQLWLADLLRDDSVG